jgi:hypothetical protein
MTFDEIGAAKHKSKSWATTVHGRALQNLNVILDGRDKSWDELAGIACRAMINSKYSHSGENV